MRFIVSFVLFFSVFHVQLLAQTPPACTFYSDPQNGALLTSQTTAQLLYASAPGATSYDIYLWTGDIAPTQPIATVSAGTNPYNATGLLAGTTYHWYVTPRNAAGPATNCIYTQISFTTAYTIPLNDNCTGATEVIPGTNNSCGPTAVSTTIGATASNVPACTGSAEDDIWFKFTPTSKRNKLSVSVFAVINPVIELFSGDCSSLTSIGCYSTTAAPYPTAQGLSTELPALVPGQTYYYRVYGSDGNSVRTKVNTCIAGIPDPPSNDECSGALLLTANADTSTTYSYTGNTGYASQSMISCVDPDYIASDVWFKFVATATSQKISVASVTYYDYAFQVFGGTCGNLTPLACVNNGGYNQPDTTVLNNLIVGNTYYMRVWDYHGDGAPQASFKIVINTTAPRPVNDDCTGALLVTPGPDPYCGSTTVVVSGANTGATQSIPGCAGTAEDDIWFKFVATSNRHKISVGVSAAINPVLEVFSGNCSSLTSLGCFSSKSISPSSVSADIGSFIPGQTYYYRVYGSGSNNERATINTCIATVPPAPSNDECSGALQLSANIDTSSVYNYTGVTGYPTQSLISCADPNSLAADVWFKFTAVATSQKIKVASLFSPAYPAQDYSFQVFSGTCGNLTSLVCVNSYGDGQPDSVTANNLTIGNTYYMRLWNFNGDVAQNQAFKIIINTTQILPPPPVNDDCTGALVVIPGPDPTCWSAVTTTADNIGATQSMPGCTGTAEDDIWFKFTATSNRHKISATLFSFGNPVLEVFSGDCSSLTSLGCFSSTLSTYPTISADLATFVPGQTYYYRVYGSGSNTVRAIIHTCIATVPPAPSNDECSGALQLTANADTSSAYSYTGVTGYATQSLISCTDPNYLAQDVWFKFTAVATSQKIAMASLFNYDYSFQVFSGTCDHLVSLACVNTGSYGQPDTTILNNLIIGNTYYMRVYDYHGDASPSSLEAFKIVINTTQIPAPPPTNGLQAVYYNGTALSGTPLLTRVDTSINLELTYSKQPVVLSPAPGIVPEDLFSVRWTGQIQPLYSETYTFYTLSDDGIRLWVNGVQLVDDWMNQGATEKSGSITLVAGQKYDIVVEYYENAGEAIAKLYWSSPNTPKAIVPSSQLFPSGSVVVPVPACVANITPANGTTLSDHGTTTLTWNAAASATSYDVYLWTGATAPAAPIASGITATTYTATGLNAVATYSWYVVPKNASGSATGCAANTTSFTTAAVVINIAHGLQAVYYNNATLTEPRVLTRTDTTINNDFVYVSPAPGIVNLENYSVRWSGRVLPLYSETYTFYANTDDGVRLWVNDQLLIDNWVNQGATEKSGTITLQAGFPYMIVMEYYQGTGYAVSKLSWSSPSTPKSIIPSAQLLLPADIGCADNLLPANNTNSGSPVAADLSWNLFGLEFMKEQPVYDIYVWTGTSAPQAPVATNIVGLSYRASGLAPGTLYNWYVVPKTSDGAGVNCIRNKTSFTTDNFTTVTPGTGTGLQGVYYNNATLTAPSVLTRIDPVINNDFVYVSPAPGIVNLENYSVRWTGQVQPLYSGTYTFYANTDDGVRLWVNGVQLIDNWVNQGATEKSGSISLTGGQKYDIVMEYYQGTGYAVSKLLWSSALTTKAIIPASQLYPPTGAANRSMYATTQATAATTAQTMGSSLSSISAVLSPNPVPGGQMAKLQISSSKSGVVAINTICANGSGISTKKISLVAGANSSMINTNGLAPGFYIISISGIGKPVNLKLIIK